MTSASLLPPAIVCAEDIALLHLLHSVPNLPSSNPLDKLPLCQEGYSLSISDERKLVGTLAFLSNASDDSNHVPAVCLQESSPQLSLDVLLAVNRVEWKDGDQVLQELRRGFETVFAILSSRVSEGELG